MADIAAFELYLLSFMRNEAFVGESLVALRADRADMARAREHCFAQGVQRPGHSVDVYRVLLAGALGGEHHHDAAASSYGTRSSRFRLPLFPEHHFVVYSDDRGIVGAAHFEHATVSDERPSLAALTPLRSTRQDLQPDAVVIEEWYPRLDVSCRGLTLLFDFNLLQLVRQ